ncbi:MAG: prepilin-type N-terminal cleavage/methylation domain-containing protein [Rhodospirillaceae bacterium]
MLGITHAGKAGQSGFTLIEMSIVLVIIGLIIGGILKGQEIIESSRQKNVITQIDAVRSAINTFADKYNALPGDYGSASTRISAVLTDGDDNGLIAASDAAAVITTVQNTDENLDFFNHLAGAELLSGTTIGTVGTAFGDGAALPAVAIPGAGMTLVYGNHNALTTSPRQTHWLRVHKDPTAAITTAAGSGAFTGKSLFQIDLKVDDGVGFQGNTRLFETNAACATGATGLYVALGNDQFCTGFFELLQ